MQQLLTRGIGHTKFKQTEIGEIPEECECRKVGEVCEVIMGQSPPGNSYNDIGVGLPLLNGPTEFGETTPIPVQWTSQPTKTCSSNDVLLCVRGNTTGRINTADREYCIGRGVAAIRAKPGKTDSRFIKYVFQRLEPRILQVAFGAGSTFPNINRDEISSLPIPVPPLAEQLKISEILSGVDEKTARERTRRQHLSRLKNGLMQVLLTGKVRVKVD
jgi:type I restriction enzyme S subunit